jgi:hypothetical protein
MRLELSSTAETMQATLPENARPHHLRAGVQRAIAASQDDAALAIELELVSILEGPAFRGSSRSRAFLRFVVEETLAGRQDLLKERTIGVAVFARPPDYDTGADSAVRVRANEVRKRLAAHYDAAVPKAGVRIELPLGMYAPRFAPASPAPIAARVNRAGPPPMQLWQMAAPTLVAVFLALIAIRGGVESSDAFSRFWNHALAGGTEIAVEVDAAEDGSIAAPMADAALPFQMLAGVLQVPVHVLATGSAPRPGWCVIRLSLKDKPAERETFHLADASVFRGPPRGPALWIWARNADELRSAAQILTARTGFPEIH